MSKSESDDPVFCKAFVRISKMHWFSFLWDWMENHCHKNQLLKRWLQYKGDQDGHEEAHEKDEKVDNKMDKKAARRWKKS